MSTQGWLSVDSRSRRHRFIRTRGGAALFYVFFTYGSPQGWPGNTVRRFTVTCQ